MVITELYIRNFGKLSEQHFYLRDGVQVISGENEFGKTTLHAFIRAMLFGMERGRGRAAARMISAAMNRGTIRAIMPGLCGLPAVDAASGWRGISPAIRDIRRSSVKTTGRNCR